MAAPSAPFQLAPNSTAAQPFNLAPQAQPTPAAPQPSFPTATGTPPAPSAIPMQSAVPPRPNAPAGNAVPARTGAPGSATAINRFILPDPKLRLNGETASRAWSVFLTGDEAAQGADLNIGYQNAIFDMPEASRLQVLINDVQVLDTPLASGNGISKLTAHVGSNVLRSGPNTVRLQATQRHRTDCTVPSTYDLWTDIDPKSTGLVLNGGRTQTLRTLDDLPAVGMDADGITTVRIIAPSGEQPVVGDRLLRTVQAISLRARFPHPVVVVTGTLPAPGGPGTLNVVVGTGTEIGNLLSSPPAEASAHSFIGYVDEPRLGGQALVISGPNWSDIDAGIEQLAAGVSRPIGAPRNALDTAPYQAPDAPFIAQKGSVSLADVEVPTQEFSGRRFRTEFAVGVPSDFYAQAYGITLVHLDAAYTAAVLPGSHVDIYVNGQIASTVPITSSGGGIFRHFPVKVPLRNFKPGLNQIAIEAILRTQSDEECAPGATLPGDSRFVLFNTTSLDMPNFARIGRTPDLSGLSGTAFPYNLTASSIALVLGRHDLPSYSAAATLLARMAHDAGRVLSVDSSVGANAVGNRPAIFLGSAGQLPQGILPVAGVAESARASWPAAPASVPNSPEARPYDSVLQDFRNRQEQGNGQTAANQGALSGTSNADILARWQGQVNGGAIIGSITRFENWFKQTFDISASSLRLGAPPIVPFQPSPQTTLVIAQGLNPDRTVPWTLITAGTQEQLVGGLAEITAPDLWSQVGGRLTAYRTSTRRVDVLPVASYIFLPTQPLGFSNLRLIAANWLSMNIVAYALVLAGFCVVLGISTAALLKLMGRRT
ncbi:cellulose synthase subunit [Faunimonas pinastri]|uniref:Cyclic di-GMP-binding protein n=2 Tax=Faunimonas pinastri TaxID=1855383 RepID=A0A1H9NHY5_9HYPH|nr:cellulose synthase subunit [Faunimonas pinastri]